MASVNNNSALPTTFSNLLASTPPKLGKRRAAGDSTPDQNGKRAKYVNGDATSIIVNSCSSDHSNSNSQNISVRVPKHKKHKKHKSREMVAPPPVVIQNQEPYLISDSLSDQSSSMSGFPTYGAATVQSSDKLNFTGCFGQNNNTVAFKSEEMARQSPFLPPSASNSPRFHSSLSNLDLFGAGSTTCNTSFRPKPVESRETSPRMVTPPLAVEPSITKSPPTASPRTPKKRGRKKGSKGIDSTLADASRFIGVDISHLSAPNSRTTSPAANFGNSYMDIKQKISLSGKKVKTTMELLAELQNRKTNSQEQFSNQVSPSSSSGN